MPREDSHRIVYQNYCEVALYSTCKSHRVLEFITDVDVIHVHSGETHHKSTTKADQLEYWSTIVQRTYLYSLHIIHYTESKRH